VILRILLLSAVVLCAQPSNVFAVDSADTSEDPIDETNAGVDETPRLYIYMHPASLLLTLNKLQQLGINNPGGALVYFTFESPYKPTASLVFQPSLWVAEGQFRFGCDGGYRKYLQNDGIHGFYVEGMLGAYFRGEDGWDPAQFKDVTNTFFSLNVLGYAGLSFKPRSSRFAFSMDAGIGYRYMSDMPELSDPVLTDPLVYDVNLAIGWGI